METTQIKELIEKGLEQSSATVTGGEGKYEALVISPAFEGSSPVKRHQMVYATVNRYIQSGELHALTIKAYTPDQWAKKNAT